MKIKLKLLVIILCLTNLAFAQEKVDSLKITDGPKEYFDFHFNFEHAFDAIYPMSDPVSTNQQMVFQVFEYSEEYTSKYQYFQTPYNAFYAFSNNGFSFFQNSAPLFTGFSYHLAEVFDWERLDILVDGSGVLYNDYVNEIPGFPAGTQRGFMWEAGIGAGYKINSKSTIFIKGSVFMNNMNPYGTKEIGGMNVKF